MFQKAPRLCAFCMAPRVALPLRSLRHEPRSPSYLKVSTPMGASNAPMGKHPDSTPIYASFMSYLRRMVRCHFLGANHRPGEDRISDWCPSCQKCALKSDVFPPTPYKRDIASGHPQENTGEPNILLQTANSCKFFLLERCF